MFTPLKFKTWPYVTPVLILTLVWISGFVISRPLLRAEEVTVTSQHLLTAATTGSVAIGPAFMPRCRESAIYVQWGTGASGGTIIIESSHDPNYTGTWAPLATIAWSAQSREDIIQITGIHAALRTRVSSTITGGTVDT